MTHLRHGDDQWLLRIPNGLVVPLRVILLIRGLYSVSSLELIRWRFGPINFVNPVGLVVVPSDDDLSGNKDASYQKLI